MNSFCGESSLCCFRKMKNGVVCMLWKAALTNCAAQSSSSHVRQICVSFIPTRNTVPSKTNKKFSQSKSKKILNPHLFFLSLSLLGMLSPLALFYSQQYIQQKSNQNSSSVTDTLHISFLLFSPFGAPVVQGRGGKKVKPRALPSQFLEREPKEAGNCCTIVLQ